MVHLSHPGFASVRMRSRDILNIKTILCEWTRIIFSGSVKIDSSRNSLSPLLQSQRVNKLRLKGLFCHHGGLGNRCLFQFHTQSSKCTTDFSNSSGIVVNCTDWRQSAWVHNPALHLLLLLYVLNKVNYFLCASISSLVRIGFIMVSIMFVRCRS